MKIKVQKFQMVEELQASEVEKIYSGFEGCRCGCNGEYYYNEGVEARDWDKVSVRMVNKVVKAINERMDEVIVEVFSDNSVYLQLENVSDSTPRLYGVYLKKTPTEVKLQHDNNTYNLVNLQAPRNDAIKKAFQKVQQALEA